MNNKMPLQQRGLSFGGFILGAFLLVTASLFVLKLVPAYMQNSKVEKMFVDIKHDPDMQKASPREIRISFEKRASIDDITAIKSDEIEISGAGGEGNLVLRASYSVKIPLIANISLLMEFNPSSDK